jgi:hypothetical protein
MPGSGASLAHSREAEEQRRGWIENENTRASSVVAIKTSLTLLV